MAKQYKAKCPFFLSLTNGKKLYINCSRTGHMKDAERLEFCEKSVRMAHYQNKCSSYFETCTMYRALNK